ncbi:MAG: hypothetical protein M3162_03070 [Thermoproteota archaeon]|nr:hypothetical protein [Thermoproteota archaeon]
MMRTGEPADEDEPNDQIDSAVILANPFHRGYMADMADASFSESIEGGVLYSVVCLEAETWLEVNRYFWAALRITSKKYLSRMLESRWR